ncbi:5-aminolevulic acid synthase [Rhodobacteraceae bacterium CCMM004]|nr:5-aminolevulic acid synthase [Rhodobacteraceae bacterium CCMM004]
MKAIAGGVMLILAGTGLAAAQTVDGATARAQVFSADGATAQLYRRADLDERDRLILVEAAKTQKYYGAIAYSPSEGLLAEATVASANYHSVPTAEAAALRICEDRRPRGAAPCVLAARIVPPGYVERAFQLNADATGALADYRRGAGPKALAISPGTGEWALAKGAGAAGRAVADCNAKAARRGGRDCRVAVAD